MSLLRYSFSTSVFPVLASPSGGPDGTITLTVMGTNPHEDPGAHPASITSVAITLPYGPASSDLSPKAPATPPAPDGWDVAAEDDGNAVVFTFTPTDGPVDVTDTALAFSFPNTTVNEEAGSVPIVIQENGISRGLPRLFLAKFPAGWGTVTLNSTPSPPIVPYGSGVTLSWNGPTQATYQLSFYTPELGLVTIPNGGPSLPSTGSYPGTDDPPLSLTQDTTFYLLVTGSEGGQNYNSSLQLTATVQDPPPQIDLFNATVALNEDGLGWTVTFEWITQYTTSVSISSVDGNLPVESAGYPIQVTPDAIQWQYTLTATAGELVATYTIYLQIGQFATITVADDLNAGEFGQVAAVNSDASIIAIAAANGVLVLQRSSFQSATSSTFIPIKGSWSSPPVTDLTFAANDSLLFVVSRTSINSCEVAVYETTGWSQLAVSTFDTGHLYALAVAGDGSWIVVQLYFLVPDPGQNSGVEVLSYSSSDQTLSQVANVGLDNLKPVVGVTADGNNVLILQGSVYTQQFEEYTVSDDASAPLNAVSSVSLSITLQPVSWIRVYPGATACIIGGGEGNHFPNGAVTLCDSVSLKPLSNVMTLPKPFAGDSFFGVSKAGMGMDPIFYVPGFGTNQIAVCGPAGYSDVAPS